MNIKEAMNLLEIENLQKETIKKAYKKLASDNHPDKKNGNSAIMSMINNAHDYIIEHIKKYGNETPKSYENQTVSVDSLGKLKAAIYAVIDIKNIDIELIGSWVWITGDTKTNKDILKKSGYKYAAKKQAWYYRLSEDKSFSRGKYTLDDIRINHGSRKIITKNVNNQSLTYEYKKIA